MKKLSLLILLSLGAFLCMAPSYGTITPDCTQPGPTTACLAPGQSGLLFNAERPLTNAFSQQFAIPWDRNQPTANLSVECIWATTPSTFTFQIENADTDATGNYVVIPTAGTLPAATQAPGSGNFVSRVDLNPWRGQFLRLFVQTQSANAVNVTCKLTR